MLVRVFFISFVALWSFAVSAQSLIDGKRSATVTIDQFRAISSDDYSHLYIHNESELRIYIAEDKELREFLRRRDITGVTIQPVSEQIYWKDYGGTDISLRMHSHYLRILFPLQTDKVRDVVVENGEILIGFKRDGNEIVRIYKLKI